MKAARLSCGTNRVTATTSCIETMKPMSKQHGKIDHALFIPAHSPICRAADTVLFFAVLCFGIAAVLAVAAQQVLQW